MGLGALRLASPGVCSSHFSPPVRLSWGSPRAWEGMWEAFWGLVVVACTGVRVRASPGAFGGHIDTLPFQGYV